MRRLIINISFVFAVLALGPAGFVLAASDRLEMRFACDAENGALRLSPSAEPRSYPILGDRRQRNFTACKDEAGRDCKSMTIHQFDMSCGGRRVSWFEVAAAMRGGKLGPSRIEDGRLHFIVAVQPEQASGATVPNDELRYARFILPPGFAPIAEVGSRLQIGGLASKVASLRAAHQGEPVGAAETTALPAAVNIPVPVAKPTLAERSPSGDSSTSGGRPMQTEIAKSPAKPTQLAQGWSATVSDVSVATGAGGMATTGPAVPSGWLTAVIAFFAVTTALAGAGFVFWRRGRLWPIRPSGVPLTEVQPVEMRPAAAEGVCPVSTAPIATVTAATPSAAAGWSIAGGRALTDLMAGAGAAARSSSAVLGIAAGRSLAAMATAVAKAGAASSAAGAGMAYVSRAGAGVVASAMRARGPLSSAPRSAGGGSLRERLERVGQAFGETVVPAKSQPPQMTGMGQRRGQAQNPAHALGRQDVGPNGGQPSGQMPQPPAPQSSDRQQARMDANNVASGLKSVESLFEQVAEVVGNVKPESPLRETLEFELRNIAHRISVFVGSGDKPPTGPRAAATLRGAVRDLERVRRIADSAAASFSIGLQSERASRLPQSKGEAYQVLGVNADVTEATLKKIVDALRMSWHPDLAKDEADRAEREERIKQINIAWELINDKRAA